MKRSRSKKQPDSKLKRRLELLRTTVRDLTPAQLGQVKGGEPNLGDRDGGDDPWCPPLYTAAE